MDAIEQPTRPCSISLFRSIYAPHPVQHHSPRPFSFCYANPLAPPSTFGEHKVSDDMPPLFKSSVRDKKALALKSLPESPKSTHSKRHNYPHRSPTPMFDDSPSSDSPSSFSFSGHSPQSSISSRHTVSSDSVAIEKKSLREPDQFKLQHGEKVHPHPVNEAPYMQSYEHMALESDRYTHLLLRKLCPRGSPTFHDYRDRPPSNVLDLGCGQGHWVVDAASTWKRFGTKVTGLDLVDLTTHSWELERDITDNVNWVTHNFVHDRLPFPDKSFDLVRLAGMHLAIPLERWAFVVHEIKRVLWDGGRLELIDDQMFFNHVKRIKPEAKSPAKPDHLRSLFFDSDEEDDLEAHQFSKLRAQRSASHAATEAYNAWEKELTNCREVESIFHKMIAYKYDIHPRPSEFLQKQLSVAFGDRYVPKSKSITVCLPSREFMEEHEVDLHSRKADGEGRGSWLTIDWERREKKDASTSPGAFKATGLPPSYSKKVASKLGLLPAGHPYQQEGLVVFPSTFIPMPASEVEMHVCRNMHLLLSCRAAMHDYVQDYKDLNGKRLVLAEDLDDALWEYQAFRRKRFNWPSEVPELRIDDQTLEATTRASNEHSRSERKRVSSPSPILVNNPRNSSEGLSPVRCISVFEAYKPAYRF
ncbi:S-adenosyl-L-methionine-dependent methyltransferase [Dentipellis sp. KUC8613]|nr:S-adenosyl-L-methionine-dependent methyltransferase [Dentipellis sp. KUC8613]